MSKKKKRVRYPFNAGQAAQAADRLRSNPSQHRMSLHCPRDLKLRSLVISCYEVNPDPGAHSMTLVLIDKKTQRPVVPIGAEGDAFIRGLAIQEIVHQGLLGSERASVAVEVSTALESRFFLYTPSSRVESILDAAIEQARALPPAGPAGNPPPPPPHDNSNAAAAGSGGDPSAIELAQSRANTTNAAGPAGHPSPPNEQRDESKDDAVAAVAASLRDVAVSCQKAAEAARGATEAAHDVSKVASKALQQSNENKQDISQLKDGQANNTKDIHKLVARQDSQGGEITLLRSQVKDVQGMMDHFKTATPLKLDALAFNAPSVGNLTMVTPAKKADAATAVASPTAAAAAAAAASASASAAASTIIPVSTKKKSSSKTKTKLSIQHKRAIAGYAKADKGNNPLWRNGALIYESLYFTSRSAYESGVTLSAAMGKLPSIELGRVVYRACDFDEQYIARWKEAAEKKLVFTDRAFLSSSWVPFDEQKTNAYKVMNTRLIIKSKTGKSIGHIVGNPFKPEEEVLFDRNSAFEVLSFEDTCPGEPHDFAGKYVIHMNEL